MKELTSNEIKAVSGGVAMQNGMQGRADKVNTGIAGNMGVNQRGNQNGNMGGNFPKLNG